MGIQLRNVQCVCLYKNYLGKKKEESVVFFDNLAPGYFDFLVGFIVEYEEKRAVSPFSISSGFLENVVLSIQGHDTIHELEAPLVSDPSDFVELANYNIF